MFCASQNLLAGTFHPEDFARGTAERAARKEDTDNIFHGAVAAVDELFLYCSPLADKWLAPPHPFLDPSRAEVCSRWLQPTPSPSHLTHPAVGLAMRSRRRSRHRPPTGRGAGRAR